MQLNVIRQTLTALLMLLLSVSAFGQSTVQLYGDDASVRLSDYYAYYFEENGPMTIGEVMSVRGDFLWHIDDNPNFGFHNRGLWLSNKISNVSDIREWVFEMNFSQLDKVDFYLVADNRVLFQSHQGKRQSEQLHRRPTIRAELPLAQPLELYIRVESHSSSLIAPLMVIPAAQHTYELQLDNLLWGLFYGGLIILAIYNLVLYFGAREPSLLAYVGYIITVLLWQFVWGGHVQMLAPMGLSPWLAEHTELIFVIIGISSGFFAVTFLDIREHAPTASPVVIFLLALQILMGLVSLAGVLPHIWENNLVYGIGIAAICSYIFAGFEAYFNHFKPARYFIFAWSLLASGAVIGMLSLIGVLPSNTFTTYCFQVGVFLEAGLFSLALMEKSRSQLEKEVNNATDELRHNMELIEEQNARLDIARKDAIKASNVKSQFLANMSHEIRTPLNAILGFSKELNNLSLAPEKQEQVRIINSAADNLLSIVNNVLDFSKIEAGKLQINNQPFSPSQLLEEMVTMMSKSAHMKKIEFVFDLAPLPEKLIGDVFRIKQVLNNLLGNALKFTSSGYIALRVKGRQLPHGIHELEIIIEDTGIGISRKDRKKLFTAFSQVDDAINRSYQGTGLGLVICQELVRMMRGNLQLQSTPGLGSSFSITLRTNQLSQRYSLTPTQEWFGKTVVLYDPIPATRRAGAALLHYLGAKVTTVEHMDFLRTIDFVPDYLFAVMPVSRLFEREKRLPELIQFKAEKRVLWYSGPDPFNQHPNLSQHFHTQARMPMTPWKLDGLQHQRGAKPKNPLQSKLANLPRVRILAVDDMEMNLKLLKTWISQSGAQLTLAGGGKEAVQLCQANEYDLILMDVQMPGMDGLQACRYIRQTELNLGTPIIAVTAHAFKEEQERLLASGMDDYLPKPIDVQALIDLIHRWCDSATEATMALPTLDWQLAIKRTNGSDDAARELLRDFLDMLPSSIEIIKREWHDRNYHQLQLEIHRLHGAACYTGSPKLQALADEIEGALKTSQHFIVAEQLPALILEAEILCAQGDKMLQDATLY